MAGDTTSQITDAVRLDEIERRGLSVSCRWRNTGWAGGPKWSVGPYGDIPGWRDGDTLREAIDRALEVEDRYAKQRG